MYEVWRNVWGNQPSGTGHTVAFFLTPKKCSLHSRVRGCEFSEVIEGHLTNGMGNEWTQMQCCWFCPHWAVRWCRSSTLAALCAAEKPTVMEPESVSSAFPQSEMFCSWDCSPPRTAGRRWLAAACKDIVSLQCDHCGKVNDNEVWISMAVSAFCEVLCHILMDQKEIFRLKF